MVLDFRSARITEAKQLRDFVERFAGGVINRSPNDLVIADAPNKNGHCVAAADYQRNVCPNFFFAEERRKQMTFEVIDREIRFAETDRETFRDRRADHERARQT